MIGKGKEIRPILCFPMTRRRAAWGPLYLGLGGARRRFGWLGGSSTQGEGTPIYMGKVVAERTSEVVAERSVCL